MRTAKLFGMHGSDLDAARVLLASALGSEMHPHESLYRGGRYFRLEVPNGSLVLQTNFIEDDGEATEATYTGFGVLLYVDGDSGWVTKLTANFADQLAAFKLLRASDY